MEYVQHAGISTEISFFWQCCVDVAFCGCRISVSSVTLQNPLFSFWDLVKDNNFEWIFGWKYAAAAGLLLRENCNVQTNCNAPEWQSWKLRCILENLPPFLLCFYCAYVNCFRLWKTVFLKLSTSRECTCVGYFRAMSLVTLLWYS